jgi:hypothetical protein
VGVGWVCACAVPSCLAAAKPDDKKRKGGAAGKEAGKEGGKAAPAKKGKLGTGKK